MEKREKFASRLGFLLISAGCAIGIGNVWRFPYITGQYGGAAFVLIYLFFLVVLGLPIMAMEFCRGPGVRKSCCGQLPACWSLRAQSIGTPGWACGQLSADDVLYHGGGLDAGLCGKNAARCVHRRVRRGGGRHFQ